MVKRKIYTKEEVERRIDDFVNFKDEGKIKKQLGKIYWRWCWIKKIFFKKNSET